MDTLFTWEMLASLASAFTFCYLITTQLKKFLKNWVGTDLVAVLVGFGFNPS